MEQVGNFSKQQLLLQAVFERSFEAIIIVDRALRFVEVNPSACELFGLTKEKLIGRSMTDFFVSLLPIKEQDITRRQIRNSQGTIKTVEYSQVKNLFSEYNLLVLRDVTNLQREAEAELNRQHQRVQLFSDVTLKIRQSLQLKEILHTAVKEVQIILQDDRVLIYQVFPNGNVMTISEALLNDYAHIVWV